jgi:hypothetical protein
MSLICKWLGTTLGQNLASRSQLTCNVMTLRGKYFCQLTFYDNKNIICSEQESGINFPEPKLSVFSHNNRTLLARPIFHLVHKIWCTN